MEEENRPARDEIPRKEATRFDPVICADPEQAHVSIRKGNALGTLDRDEEARCGAVSPGDSTPGVMIGADRSHFTPFPTFADDPGCCPGRGIGKSGKFTNPLEIAQCIVNGSARLSLSIRYPELTHPSGFAGVVPNDT